MAAGDLQGIVDYAYNYEHPPLTKLVYGAAILPLPPAPLLPEQPSTLPPASKLPQPHMRLARTVSAVLGALEVLALALLNPLAGLFLAIHTWQIKYTSQIMLEPLPSLMSALAVLCYFKARGRSGREKAPVSRLADPVGPRVGPDGCVEVYLLRGGPRGRRRLQLTDLSSQGC